MTPPGMVASDRTCEEVERALCRSVLWEALAIGFRPPEMATIGRLHAGTGLIAAAEVVAGPELAASVRTLVERDAEPTTLDQAYQRLFGHVAHGETPLFETEYGTDQSFLQPHALADVGGFYAAFGLDLARGPAMRPDHAACECEFMMFLARKEA